MPTAPKFSGDVISDSTSVSIPVTIRKTSDNREQTGVTYGSVTAYYWRDGADPVQITPVALGSLTASHTAGGWYEVSSTHFPGLYRFDIPDAAVAEASNCHFVAICVQVANCYAFHKVFALEYYSQTNTWMSLNDANYGLPQLVRAKTPSYKLDLTSQGYAKSDLQLWRDQLVPETDDSGCPTVAVQTHTTAGLAEITTEIETALETTTRTQPTSAPGDAPSLTEMVAYIYSALKNKATTTNNSLTLYDTSGTAIATAVLSDDGTTFTRNKLTTP